MQLNAMNNHNRKASSNLANKQFVPHYCFQRKNYQANFFETTPCVPAVSLKIGEISLNYYFEGNEVSPQIRKIKEMKGNRTELDEYVVFNNLFDDTNIRFLLLEDGIDFELEAQAPHAAFCYSFSIEHPGLIWNFDDKKTLLFVDPATPQIFGELACLGCYGGNKELDIGYSLYVQAISSATVRYYIILDQPTFQTNTQLLQSIKMQMKIKIQ